ncbi:hypothetical protein HMPREF3156_01099 [Neisseria sp. HMSC06F02]|nr:hypothetical protein HMPREF3156_01099 [Neisseria sp. HMSC06F02]
MTFIRRVNHFLYTIPHWLVLLINFSHKGFEIFYFYNQLILLCFI